ncbi:hypothetical protein AK812_SmicGene8216 [Symbiodinium microadriaticum]|uniref:Uncharacterized protein n=1 Tax=Symbiodinium microadriaticum TaxID=2951 RepID=A0A1Q9ELR1_SYMMI|nr:hypothetical protein AK812_SmicGene8216 [Symbiodinium microadriaticum]
MAMRPVRQPLPASLALLGDASAFEPEAQEYADESVPDDGAFPDEGFAEVTEGAEGAEEAAEAEWPQEAPIGFRTGRVATVSTALGCSAVAEAKIKGEIGGVEVVRASRIGS